MAALTPEEIKLQVGEATSVTLKGLATAGFEWNYTTDNKDCIKITREFAVPETSNLKGVGANADEIFTVVAQKKGTVHLHFFQKRSWEKNEKPINEKEVTIVIE